MKKRILQGMSPVFLLSHDYRFRMVRLDMVTTFAALMSCLFLQMAQPSYAQTPPQISTTQTPAQTTEIATPIQPVPTAPAVQTVAEEPAPTRACIPNKGHTAYPAQIDLGSIEPGLTAIRQGPYYYQVFGSDLAILRTQMMACGPAGEFAGQASYTINWSYALRADETGACRVVGVKVGVRTSMILPYRQETGSENASFLATWQALSSGLSTHEYGHVTLSESYGERLLGALQNYLPGDCYTMNQGVEAAAQAIVGQLKSEQAHYDATTAHGATQGAAW